MLRTRKNRRYNETNDEETDGFRKFDLQHQIKTDRFDQIRDKHLQEYSGDQITLRLVQEHGFEKPIIVEKPDGLDLSVPPKTFLVRDVRNYVGHQRIIDVMDVKTQKNIEMSMKDWCKYYESKNKDRLMNVISLEFSHTKLDELVEAPLIVRLLDWVDQVWPKFLKQSQTESTNTITKMMYPKVQKYCLMSVKGSYTDFHIDFGGTSVWYHILRGKKIFWMVPPTELNLQIFEEWTLSGMQQDVFFGDTVEECFRVELVAGNTFFIPSGWIHAVYTLEDSLVFGGNFLHSFGIENQLKVAKIEDATKVPIKFRYPFYTEILWYVVQHYVYCLMNKDHLNQQEVMRAVESTKATLEANKANNVEIEDESTETEIEEVDTKPTKSSAKAIKRKKVPAKSKKNSRAKSKKAPTPSSTDDESTEVDTDVEETSAKKQPVATCRMTKNSLLRLQYEIDEQKAIEKAIQLSTKSIKSESEKNGNKIKSEPQPQAQPQQESQPPTTLNLAEFALSNDSKTNGWTNSASTVASAQPQTWSTPVSVAAPEKRKVHMTKYELNGLRALQAYLSKLSKAKKNLPILIRNSRALLDDCRKLIVEHENDDPELAVTGIPITPELLNTPKKTDINDLIEQFFKSDTTDQEESPTKKLGHNSVACSLNKAHNRSRQSSLSIDNHSESTDSAGNKTKESDTPESPNKAQKETKCLSPNKKMMNSSATLATASTAPSEHRPKSPPTRPLSMNQYSSSKTKTTQSNSNLLLPGSFADLIAATSTEKVFDVTSADVTSSIFGIKDLAQPASRASHSTSSSSSSGLKDTQSTLDHSKAGSTKPSQPKTSFSSIDSLAGSPTPSSGPSKEPQKQHAQNPTIPPSPQKRYIVPNQFKPANKEKLIFASAPYVSPLNNVEHLRPGDLYPWSTPARVPEPSKPYNQMQHKPVVSNQPAPTTQSKLPPNDRLPSPPLMKSKPILPQQKPSALDVPKPADASAGVHQAREQSSAKKRDEFTTQVFRPTESPSEKLQQAGHNRQESVSSTSSVVPQAGPPAPPPEQVAAKKATKPRGPPKKSKEARQVLESQPELFATTPSVPVSVIMAGPSSATNTGTEPTKSEPQPQPKPKPKRPKKQKVDATQAAPVPQTVIRSPQPQAPVYGIVTQPNKSNTNNGTAKIAPQPYLLTRPLMFNPLTSLSAAQYQQMQRAPGVPMFTSPMVSGAPGLGALPFQQGARIVWATQPRLTTPMSQTSGVTSPSTSVIRPPVVGMPTTTTAAANKTTKMPNFDLARNQQANTAPKPKPSIPTQVSNANVDNAALLSLATTALSTASLAPTPTLSHLSHLMPGNQAAIVVSSAAAAVAAAGNTQPLFAGQQYLRPAFLPGMPLAHFVNQPGFVRPPGTTGQLVFARLPNQSQQQRYLITQPGFMQQQRIPAPHIVTSQPTPTLAYAAFRPQTESPKELKSKKVKTS